MAAGYSAGRVYLQVVPSYRTFMKRLRQDFNGPLGKAIASELERSMSKAGVSAGDQYGKNVAKSVTDSARKELAKVDLSPEAKKISRDIDRALGQIGSDNKIGRSLADIQKEIRSTGQVSRENRRDVDGLATAMIGLADATNDASKANRNIAAAKALDPGQVNKYQGALRAMGREQANAAREQARAERAGNAVSRGLQRATNALTGNTRAARDNESGLKGSVRGLLNMNSNAQDGANAFRFFNAAILGAVALGPALIPVLAALAGGLGALIPILLGVGAGAGVFALALSGIGDAVKALGEQQDATSASSGAYAKSVRNAGRAVADARRGLADAYRSSADGINNALERQRAAELRLRDAQRDARKAQQELTAARVEAKRELADLDNQIAQNALDERQGVIDLFNAYNAYGATMSDPGATNLEKETADIGLKQAELNLKRIREEEKRLADEKKKADRGGVNGTDTVRRAEENLTGALERQKEARRDLAKAAQDVDRARADGARRVADAQRTLNRAQEDYADAVAGGVEANDKLRKSMEKLSPAGRAFAEYIFSLRDGFYELRAIAQEGFLPGLQAGIQTFLSTYGAAFKGWVSEMSELLGELAFHVADALTGPAWQAFFRDFGASAQVFTEDAVVSVLNWLTGFANLMRLALPLAEQFSEWLRGLSGDFAGWTESQEGQQQWMDFLGYIEEVGPLVADFFGALGGALANLGRALGPVGESVLIGLTDFLKFIAGVDPDMLRIVLVTAGSLIVALQVAAGIIAFLSTAAAVAGAGLLIFVAAIAGIAAAWLYLSKSGKDGGFFDALEPVAKILGRIIELIKDNLIELWEDSLKPAILDVADVFTKEFLPAFEKFYPVLEKWVIKPLMWVFKVLLKGLIAGVQNLITGALLILTGFMKLFSGSWSGFWDGIWDIIRGIGKLIIGFFQVSFFGGVLKFLGGFAKAFKSGWSGIYGFTVGKIRTLISEGLKRFRAFRDGIVRIFGTVRDKIGGIFEKIGSLIREPFKKAVRFVVNTVLNKGLISGVNWIAGKVGLGSKNAAGKRELITPFKIEGFATGGWTGPGGMYDVAGVVHADEHVTKKSSRRRMESRYPGLLDWINSHGTLEGYAKGGRVWPANTKRLSGNYPGHSGIDIAAANGSVIKAASKGRIIHAGYGRGFGKAIFSLGEDGIPQIYGHSQATSVKAGQTVRPGQRLGLVGSTGNSTGPHLHFEIARSAPGTPSNRPATFAWLKGAGFSKGSTGGSPLDVLDGLSKFAQAAVRNPLKYLTDRVKGQVAKGSGFGATLAAGVGSKVTGGTADWLKKKIADLLGVGQDWFGRVPGNPLASIGMKLGSKLGASLVGGADGASLRKPRLYDNGGWLQPGYSTVYNATGRPEPVLTGKQWDMMRDMADTSRAGDTYEINQPGATADEIAEAIFFRKRVQRRRGGRR